MNSLLEFWKLASRLKNEPRRGWLGKVHVRKIESVADHSFGVAILSLFEGERRGYEVGRVLRLALVHDLEEAFTGDFTPRDKRILSMRTVSRRRVLAQKRILALAPPALRRDLEKAWRELRTGKTREARLVKDIDRLEMAFQARYYESKGTKASEVSDFYRSARREIKDSGLKQFAEKWLESG